MNEILGHAAIVDTLGRSVEHPAPGYLFHGPDGVGKRLVADWFAARLLEIEPVQLAAHPDAARLKRGEGEKNIPVEAVRDLVARMHLTSASGGRKIALIEEADAMNEQGMNALLKAVEEPEGRATFLFVSERPDRLPATLRSRLVSVAFSPVSRTDLVAWLVASGIGQIQADALADAARGCPGIAKRIFANLDAWKRRRELAEGLLKCFAESSDGRTVGEIERVAKSLQSAEDPAEAWRAFLSECERLAPDRLADPARLARFGEALAHARRAVGGAVSPALALEWGVVAPYYGGDVPTFLHPTYL